MMSVHWEIHVLLSSSSYSRWYIFVQWLARRRLLDLLNRKWDQGFWLNIRCWLCYKDAAKHGVGSGAWKREDTNWRRQPIPGGPPRKTAISLQDFFIAGGKIGFTSSRLNITGSIVMLKFRDMVLEKQCYSRQCQFPFCPFLVDCRTLVLHRYLFCPLFKKATLLQERLGMNCDYPKLIMAVSLSLSLGISLSRCTWRDSSQWAKGKSTLGPFE